MLFYYLPMRKRTSLSQEFAGTRRPFHKIRFEFLFFFFFFFLGLNFFNQHFPSLACEKSELWGRGQCWIEGSEKTFSLLKESVQKSQILYIYTHTHTHVTVYIS